MNQVAAIVSRGNVDNSRPVWQTNDAAPFTLPLLTVAEGTTGRIMITVIGRAADGTSKAWQITRTGKYQGGVLTLVGSTPAPIVEGDAGATAWTAQLSVGGADVSVVLTGDAAKQVAWSVVVDSFLVTAT